MAYNRLTLAEKLQTKTRQSGECLLWIGQKNPKGYGVLRLDGRHQRSHRLAYELVHGPIEDGQVIRHKCDNPACINVDHLEVGTQSDNVADMWSRGRARRASGSANGRAKLTDEQVVSIRARYVHHDRINGAAALAREFGISHMAMKAVIAGRSYRP